MLRRAAQRHPERMLAIADVELQVRALYESLQHNYELAFIASTISFKPDDAALAQRVRRPAETLRTRFANCVDGVLLFASLFEACSLRPALLVSTKHALIAWDKTATGGELDYLETTMLQTNKFADARTLGRRKAQTFFDNIAATNDPRWHRLLPLRDLRRQRILPLE